jgi:hypothetical protein
MHGIKNAKAKKAHYQNTKEMLIQTNAAIWFNKKCRFSHFTPKHEACPESKDTKALNMYKIINLQKRHCE